MRDDILVESMKSMIWGLEGMGGEVWARESFKGLEKGGSAGTSLDLSVPSMMLKIEYKYINKYSILSSAEGRRPDYQREGRRKNEEGRAGQGEATSQP